MQIPYEMHPVDAEMAASNWKIEQNFMVIRVCWEAIFSLGRQKSNKEKMATSDSSCMKIVFAPHVENIVRNYDIIVCSTTKYILCYLEQIK